MRVIVSAFSNLYTDQRIEKVCQTLYEQGYQVELIGNDWNDARTIERPYPVEKISLKSKTLRWAYLEFNFKLYKRLKKLADRNTILHANDLDALLPNYWVSHRLKIPFVYDSHELFTEMPSLNGRWTQKIWQGLEYYLMPKIVYMITTSHSYAQWFRKKYKKSPIVLQNFPRYSTTPPRQTLEKERNIIIYQGVINPSRGIDKAINAMQYIDNAVLKIVGDGPKKYDYEKLVLSKGLENKVYFLGKLSPRELQKLTSTADVGLSIEENGGFSYLYSLPNKISDYIQARIPLVSSNFPEMSKIHQQYTVGEQITSHRPKVIAQAIQKILARGKEYYLSDLETAAQHLCWEREEPKLIELYNKVLREKTH